MLSIKPIAGALGAEIHGIDLSVDPSAEICQELRLLLVEHQVIFFRDQDLSLARLKALAELFGPLQSYPVYDTVEGHPEITILESTAENPTKINAWHSDITFCRHPPTGSLLRARICLPGAETHYGPA